MSDQVGRSYLDNIPDLSSVVDMEAREQHRTHYTKERRHTRSKSGEILLFWFCVPVQWVDECVDIDIGLIGRSSWQSENIRMWLSGHRCSHAARGVKHHAPNCRKLSSSSSALNDDVSRVSTVSSPNNQVSPSQIASHWQIFMFLVTSKHFLCSTRVGCDFSQILSEWWNRW